MTASMVTSLLASCSSAPEQSPTPPAPAARVSATLSDVSVGVDSLAVGSATTIVVVPRTASSQLFGPDVPVIISVVGGTSAGQLSAVRFFAFDSSYRATFIGSTAGSALRIRVLADGVSLTAAPFLTVHAPRPTFSFCSTTGAVCEFIGLRDVRLVATDGQTYTQTFYGSVPCAASGYDRGFSGAPTGNYVRCEIAERKLEPMTNPMPGMAGLDAAVLLVPRGDPGIAQPLIRPSSFSGTASEEGSFRMTCELAKMAFVDPIVYPGSSSSSHLHMFFGNTGITPSSTATSVTSSGNGSCTGGTVNRTGYWVPALFDVRNSEIIAPAAATIYYKTGYNVEPASIRAIPPGLVMIAGSSTNVGQLQVVNQLPVVTWECEQSPWTNTGAVPSCPVGDIVRLVINFPQCWDGVHLDSPDHKQHMAYPNYRSDQRSSCPATHPVMLPIVTEIFRWPVGAGMNPAFWRLTSDMYPITTRGGYSAHADWMNGWVPAEFQTIITRCLQGSRDCGVNVLGDGRELY
ncbi:MAG: DUF1996 domain-containing protein [Gemmatimonadaceae bacterium]|nr:DUF1996 domain-containing protein [Gemmatimonadaceae bacterium]